MLDLLKEYYRAKIDFPIITKHLLSTFMRRGCMEIGRHTYFQYTSFPDRLCAVVGVPVVDFDVSEPRQCPH